jgi:hypothetical protein
MAVEEDVTMNLKAEPEQSIGDGKELGRDPEAIVFTYNVLDEHRQNVGSLLHEHGTGLWHFWSDGDRDWSAGHASEKEALDALEAALQP